MASQILLAAAPSQAGLPITLHGLERGTLQGVQTPYVH
jgi:hypothetical protein